MPTRLPSPNPRSRYGSATIDLAACGLAPVAAVAPRPSRLDKPRSRWSLRPSPSVPATFHASELKAGVPLTAADLADDSALDFGMGA